MELSLAIDQGNSSAKVSVFDGRTLLNSWRLRRPTAMGIARILKDCPVRKAIYSSVTGNDEATLALLQERMAKLWIVDEKLPMPLAFDYATPQTLGRDRMAAAVGAFSLLPGRNVLVVDAGTAVTCDFVSADGRFAGGNIAPGLVLRFRALARSCAQLPKIDEKGDIPELGFDTATAIRAGVVRGMVAEVAFMAQKMSERHGDIAVVMTGGDGAFLASMLEMPNVVVDKDLVAIGLNRILEYNESL